MNSTRGTSQSYRLPIFTFAVLFLTLAGLVGMASAQTYTVLHAFNTDSAGPQDFTYAGYIVQGRDGNLYGLSDSGGASNNGTFFRISPTGTETTLFSFDGTHGAVTDLGLTLGSDGNFYGAAISGGTSNRGVVYKLTPAGAITVLHNFADTTDGYGPNAPPVQAKDGNFYGTTNFFPGSTVYKVSSAGVFKTLHTTTSAEGWDSSFILGTDGILHGSAGQGGANNDGTLFKVTTAGVYTVLHTFTGTDGNMPFRPLVQATDGSFYGITVAGGTTNEGVIYKITSGGVFSVLHNLNGAIDGRNSEAGLMQASDGNLYGTTFTGGTLNGGTIFKVTTAGVFTVVHNFDSSNTTNGANPASNLTQDTNGLLYGDTHQGPNNNGVFYSLNIGAAPFAKLALTSGKAGTSVGIFGQGFLTATGVTFGGVAGTFTAAGDNYMTAAVPTGGKSGPVVILIPSGNLTSSATFKVTPMITSFTPPSGPVGTVVMITGTGLAQTSRVTFGGVIAKTFTINSGTQVTATVPVGAKTGKIAISTPGGAATSAATFTVQ